LKKDSAGEEETVEARCEEESPDFVKELNSAGDLAGTSPANAAETAEGSLDRARAPVMTVDFCKDNAGRNGETLRRLFLSAILS
jgi:hypothetical protein